MCVFSSLNSVTILFVDVAFTIIIPLDEGTQVLNSFAQQLIFQFQQYSVLHMLWKFLSQLHACPTISSRLSIHVCSLFLCFTEVVHCLQKHICSASTFSCFVNCFVTTGFIYCFLLDHPFSSFFQLLYGVECDYLFKFSTDFNSCNCGMNTVSTNFVFVHLGQSSETCVSWCLF